MKKSKNEKNKLNKLFWKKVKEGELASLHTTLGIGGPVDYFIEVNDLQDLVQAITECKKHNIEFYIIGGGSDLLVSDEGYKGMLIVNKISKIKMIKPGNFIVASGTSLQHFINFVIDNGYQGLEKMSGIPGSVGGAIYGNAGGYGQTISDFLKTVTVLDGLKKRLFRKENCNFEYRECIFKNNKFIILEAEFVFDKGQKEFLKKISLDTIQLRAQKYSPTTKCPGSFFKNIIVNTLKPSVLKQIPPDKITYGKIPAGYLLESVGAKGAVKGDAKIAEFHGNLIMNIGSATAKDFIDLANKYSDKVEKKFKIKLEPEVQLLGFKDYDSKKKR